MDTNNNNQFDGFNNQQNPQQQFNQQQFGGQQFQQYDHHQYNQNQQFNQQQQYSQNQYNQQTFNPQQQFNNLPEQKNTVGTVAFVMSIISTVCCGGPFSILGIILGIISLVKVGKNGKALIAILLSVVSLAVWILMYIIIGSTIFVDYLGTYSERHSNSDYEYNSDYDYNSTKDYSDNTSKETVEPEVSVNVTNSTEEYDFSTLTNFPVEYDKISLVEFTTPDGTDYTIDVKDMSTIINCDLISDAENKKTTLEQYERESFSFFDVNDDWDSFTFFCYNSAEEPVGLTEMKTSDFEFNGLMDLPYFKIDGFVDNTITEEQFLELMGEPSNTYEIDKETNRIDYCWYGNDSSSISPTETSDCQIIATFEQGKLDGISFYR